MPPWTYTRWTTISRTSSRRKISGKLGSPSRAILPAEASAHVVREDPNQRGLLVAGTDTGLFYAEGDQDWKPLQAGFPTAPVFDLKFATKTHDLVVVTHGRGMFILDDITPLEHMASAKNSLEVFHPLPARRWERRGEGGGFSMGAFTTPNPPTGAVIDYFVPAQGGSEAAAAQNEHGAQDGGRGGRRGGAIITINDAAGHVVRQTSGPANPGFNRFVWPLNYEGATPLNFIPQSQRTGGGEGGGRGGGAPEVAPGTYQVTVTVNGQTQKTEVQVEPDPRAKADPAGFAEQVKDALAARDALSQLDEMVNRIEAMKSQLQMLERAQLAGPAVAARAHDLHEKLVALEEPLYNPAALNDSKAYLHYLSRLHDRLSRVAGQMSANYGAAPSQMTLDAFAGLQEELKKRAEEFRHFVAVDVAAFNKFAAEQGAQALATGKVGENK